MTFIITFFALVMERFFHWRHMRHLRWFAKYQQWLSTKPVNNWPSMLVLLVVVLPPVLLVAIVNLLLSGWFFDLFKMIFGVIVLLYCLGPDNLWLQAYSSINELHSDDPKQAMVRVNAAFHIGEPENTQAFHRAFSKAIFLAAYSRVFAVIFWFVLLGPAGALLYRLVAQLSVESALGLSQVTEKLRRLLDWVPIRIFTFIFALSGHFTHVYNCWKAHVLLGHSENECMLADCGIAALDVTKEDKLPEDGSAEKEAMTLLDRVFVMSLVILAVIVLVV